MRTTQCSCVIPLYREVVICQSRRVASRIHCPLFAQSTVYSSSTVAVAAVIVATMTGTMNSLNTNNHDRPPASKSFASLPVMMLSIVVGFILLPGVVLGSRVETKSLNVDYQIHSYNDLKELPQVLVKGARRFKFDPHYVRNSSGCGDRKSCLLLNHDNPTTDVATYNTSTELLNYLKSNEFASITGGERVTVALCFKAAPSKCQKTAAFEDWLALVEDFYLQAQSVPKQVEFILDGDAKPIDCMVGRWEKWNSVWISSPAEPFYSNTKENDLYRFQILNNPENKQNWTWLATPDVNYGKFSNGSYPYQLWEPDSMQDIRSYIDIYHQGARHEPGYHFAINVDIAMFRVFSSRAQVQPALSGSKKHQDLAGCESTLSISQPLLGPGSTDGAGDANPLLVPLGTTGLFATVAMRNHKEIVVTTVRADTVEYQASRVASVTLSSEDSAWLLGDQTDTTLVSAVYLPGHDAQTTVVAVMNSAGRLLLLSLSATDDSLQVTSVSQQSLPESLLTSTALDLIPYKNSNVCDGSCWLVVTTESIGVNLSVLKGTYHSTDGKTMFALVQTTSLVAPSPVGGVDAARVVMLDEAAGAAPVVFLSQGLTVYAGEVSLATTSATPLWRAVSTGKHVQLATAGHGADRALMMVTDFGYCYNSHSHNTRAYPTVCASTPSPTETVLDYSLGLASHWLEELRGTTNVAKDPTSTVAIAGATVSYVATSCNPKILHGSYDQGSRPAIALTKQAAPGADAEMYFFLEVHEGLPVAKVTKLGSRGGGECGDPVHHDGIVLDAFEIDSWVRSLQRVYA